MDLFFSRKRNPAVLAVLLLFQLMILGYQVRRPDAGGIRLVQLWGAEAVLPVERGSQRLVGETRNFVRNYIALRAVRRQNESLQARLNAYELENQRLRSAVRDLPRLDALLGFQRSFGVRTVAAQVIASGAAPDAQQVIYLDRGAAAGIARNMAVITPDGVVGKISQVVAGSAMVLLVTDPESGAGVLIGDAGTHAVLHGLGEGRAELRGVYKDEPVAVGAALTTSGEDQVYPKGLRVGTVATVTPGPITQTITVKLAADLSRLEEVLVITATLPPPVQATAPGLTAAEVRQALLPSVPAAGVTMPAAPVPAAPVAVTPPRGDTPPPEGDQLGGAAAAPAVVPNAAPAATPPAAKTTLPAVKTAPPAPARGGGGGVQ